MEPTIKGSFDNVPRKKKLDKSLTIVFTIVSIIVGILSIYSYYKDKIQKADIEISAKPKVRILENDKTEFWRYLTFTNTGVVSPIKLLQQQIVDGNHNVIATFEADMYFQNGQYNDFFQPQIGSSFQAQIKFVQTDAHPIKFESEIIYYLKLIYSSNNKIKTDSIPFLVKKNIIKILKNEGVQSGIEIDLGK
jgi:hypothetical protein